MRPPCRLPRGCRPEDRTTHAIDTKALEIQFCGCSQALLYNMVRPHRALGNLPPNIRKYARSWLEMRDAKGKQNANALAHRPAHLAMQRPKYLILELPSAAGVRTP